MPMSRIPFPATAKQASLRIALEIGSAALDLTEVSYRGVGKQKRTPLLRKVRSRCQSDLAKPADKRLIPVANEYSPSKSLARFD